MMYDVVIFLVLLLLGYTIGSIVEKRHYVSIRKRESEFAYLPTIMLKKPLNDHGIINAQLVGGSVVISIDFFKKFMAFLVQIFGGQIGAYETLVDRARREALLRMKEEAKGASEIINVRLETSSITKNTTNNVGAIEVFAYGTAIYR